MQAGFQASAASSTVCLTSASLSSHKAHCQMALCLIFVRDVLFDFTVTQICVAHVSWSQHRSCIVVPLRMQVQRNLTSIRVARLQSLGQWVVESWLVFCHFTLKKTLRSFNIRNYVLPPTFKKNVIRSFKSPRHILIIACRLGPFSSYFESRLSSFPPRHSEAQNYPDKSKVLRTETLVAVRQNESCDRVVGVSTDTWW